MTKKEIRQVENGYIVSYYNEEFHEVEMVFKSLTEISDYYEGKEYHLKSINYNPSLDNGSDEIRNIRAEYIAGNRIDAIKRMRNLFNNVMGLKESKELIEILIG